MSAPGSVARGLISGLVPLHCRGRTAGGLVGGERGGKGKIILSLHTLWDVHADLKKSSV